MQANVADSKKLATKLRTQCLNVARKLAHQDGPNGDVKYYMREADENRNLAPEDEIEKLRLVLQNLEYLLQESAPAEPEKAHLAAPSVTSATRCLKYHPKILPILLSLCCIYVIVLPRIMSDQLSGTLFASMRGGKEQIQQVTDAALSSPENVSKPGVNNSKSVLTSKFPNKDQQTKQKTGPVDEANISRYGVFADAPVLLPESMYPVEYLDISPGFNHRMGLGKVVQEMCNGTVPHVVPFSRCERLPGDRSSPLLADGFVIIHFYFEGEEDRLKVTSLMTVLDAVLITQNLLVVKVWIWTSGPGLADRTSAFSRRYQRALAAGLVEIKTIDWGGLIESSPLGHEAGANGTYGVGDLLALPVTARSDVFRYLVLHRHGGIYLDTDVLVTRDLLYLVGTDCEWGASANWHYNNHIMVMRRNSPSAEFLVRAVAKYPWDQPLAWPKQPATKLRHWAYNDGVTQYCESLPARCRLFKLPMFLVDHFMDHRCSPTFHDLGCTPKNASEATPAKVRRDLLLSTQLLTLHRNVPYKSQCGQTAGRFGDGTTADSVMFAAIHRRMKCRPDDGDEGEVCVPERATSLRELLLGEAPG